MTPTPRPLSEEMKRTPADREAFRVRLDAGAAALGFALPDETQFAATQTGFDAYRKACGIKHFSAREACRPNSPSKAKSVGYTRLVPPQFVWPWCALLLTLADGMRRAVGEPVELRNLWRPQSYNALVATSGIDSDHPNGCGADLDFASVRSRAKAEGFCRGVHLAAPGLGMSLGLGARVVHVGVLTVKGSRVWFYEGYGDKRVGLG